jgi:RNA polymerase sigma factor (sigma-70 family)
MVAADRVRVVADVLAELSHRHRAVIGLRYGAGWTQRHIARFAGCSREAVAGLERRALGEFRRRLAARGIRGTENI